jgi:hypothetical protein
VRGDGGGGEGWGGVGVGGGVADLPGQLASSSRVEAEPGLEVHLNRACAPLE